MKLVKIEFERLLLLESGMTDDNAQFIEKLYKSPIIRKVIVSNDLPDDLSSFAGAILACKEDMLPYWINKAKKEANVPFFSIFQSHPPFHVEQAEVISKLDGLLFYSMTAEQITWGLRMGQSHWRRRMDMTKEIHQLKIRLKERKVIDKAKEILAELKNISLAEAYQMLRLKAMSDRQSIETVSRSIVTAYDLIQIEKGKSKNHS
ncbi:ANTAR domain-containing response regulator [Aneurinibacillus danicus]|nr:ANTAR domain-containing protein [Aneurinibacillus danicus]